VIGQAKAELGELIAEVKDIRALAAGALTR
jgi:hypothetical protein